ncbi:hypothetical protein QJS04_geneDACA017309 [Acorus gramineus]|uniref:Uncharacterized protein n=1 Tax=Acorus gramineus TaxID=55184 RepID=A0AAV9BDY6_ACOGR|nr:hypothetical protein QJS04_geneDACA017309 [Acorus gramineus]
MYKSKPRKTQIFSWVLGQISLKNPKQSDSSAKHGSERAKDDLLAGDGETHIVVEAELLFSPPEEALELRVTEEGHGDDEPAPVLADVDGEVTFGDVERVEFVGVVAALFVAAEAGASPEDVLQHCCLGQLG